MSRSDAPPDGRPVALSLSVEEQWTLHHVLLDRIEREVTAPSDADPPPVEVFRAFEALDAGETRFTRPQLETIRDLLAEYHHSRDRWAAERARLERLLAHVSDRLGQDGPASSRTA